MSFFGCLPSIVVSIHHPLKKGEEFYFFLFFLLPSSFDLFLSYVCKKKHFWSFWNPTSGSDQEWKTYLYFSKDRTLPNRYILYILHILFSFFESNAFSKMKKHQWIEWIYISIISDSDFRQCRKKILQK